MTLYIKDIFPKEFIKFYLPTIIKSKSKQLVKQRNTKQMNKLLNDVYKTDVNSLVDSMKFSLNKVGSTYSLTLNNNILDDKSKVKLITLLKLVDYGNLKVKGLHIVDSAIRYVQTNMNMIYKTYMLKNEMGGE